MKVTIFRQCAVIHLVAAFTGFVFAAVESPYEVGTWENFCRAAVSHTFDDGTPKQFSKAMPLFDAKGFKMTLGTVTSGGMFPGWDKLNAAFNKGHEIASHSVTHPTTINDDEMKRSQEAIRTNVPGELCVSLIYPNCNLPAPVTDVDKYYIVARGCGGGPAEKTPANFRNIPSLVVGQSGAQTDLDAYAQSALSGNGWGVYLHHGIDDQQDHSWAWTSSASLGNHIDYLNRNRDKFWVETFGNVARYIKERDAVSVSVKSTGDNSITVAVTDNLPDSIFNYPLSIRRPLPEGWTNVYVIQGGKEVKDTIVTVNSKKHLMFQVLPDAGDVVIAKEPVAVTGRSSGPQAVGASPVKLLHTTLLIDSRRFNASKLTVELSALTGKTLGRCVPDADDDRIALPYNAIGRSAFIVKISGGSSIWSGVFMPRW
ncbi:MAG: polysaccharide deacetylase family protein [Chitinispirillaceae bacterium]|nr:polysaccharide deacetylase family protein [Chitinispirillaceae bacterium]